MKISIEVDSVKLTREALCIAQSAINELDKHRPLDTDGKHGD